MKKHWIIILSVLCTCLLVFIIGLSLHSLGVYEITAPEDTISQEAISSAPLSSTSSLPTETTKKPIVVLDAGHGKLSVEMTEAEKKAAGWLFSPSENSWGEWRHWKSHTLWQDCEGNGCNKRAPKGSGCWYPIENGDRNTEPQINLANALSAKEALEQLGYIVRLTRTTNEENPSMTQRLTYCYPNQDITKSPDADLFVCLHSNAGGGKGSYYIALSGPYDQAGIPEDYIQQGNLLGNYINQQIVSDTSLCANQNGVYTGYPELILFCKSPIPIAYLEIGFFDNPEDLKILQTESDEIGRAIAKGIDLYWKETQKN